MLRLIHADDTLLYIKKCHICVNYIHQAEVTIFIKYWSGNVRGVYFYNKENNYIHITVVLTLFYEWKNHRIPLSDSIKYWFCISLFHLFIKAVWCLHQAFSRHFLKVHPYIFLENVEFPAKFRIGFCGFEQCLHNRQAILC